MGKLGICIGGIKVNSELNYNKMNWLYNALYGDMSLETLKELDYVNNHRKLLNSYQKDNLIILDSACGNGVQATALAINGYNVIATDISNEMIALTNDLAKKHGIKLETDVKAWIELPDTYSNSFDIVLCTGNSIVHSPDAISRQNNLEALSKLLKPKGTLVIETRNWDKVIAENKKYTVYNKVSYKDKEYIPLYHWNLKGMEREAKVEILFQEIDNDNRVTLYQSDLNFTPFTYNSLLEMMRNVKLKIIRDTFDMQNDWYLIYGEIE
jgi:glycine/sarcosine N-methyltransferase